MTTVVPDFSIKAEFAFRSEFDVSPDGWLRGLQRSD
jgi:hypothetical protein